MRAIVIGGRGGERANQADCPSDLVSMTINQRDNQLGWHVLYSSPQLL